MFVLSLQIKLYHFKNRIKICFRWRHDEKGFSRRKDPYIELFHQISLYVFNFEVL